MGTNRIGIGDGDPSSKQRSKRRTSVAPECTVCKPHEPTEDETRMSTLCQAALDNDPDKIGEKAAECRDLSAFGPEGCPPLHLGAHEGHVAVVHKLLALGAQLDARSVEGSTALHVAAKSGRKEVVQILNFARADLGATDWRGKTALHHVCEYARENGDGRKMAEDLLHRGADVNISDACGYTPLMLAMENLPLMRLLVELGTKPSTDQAALYVEQCRGDERREEVLELLVAKGWCPRFLKTGGDISDVAAAAATAGCGTVRCEPILHQAVGNGDADEPVEKLSLREDPKVLGTSEHAPLNGDAHSGASQLLGSTPLRVGTKRGLAEADGDLLTSNSFSETTDERAPIANVASQAYAAPDDEGRQPIHLAAASGKVGVVKAFLRASTDMINSRDTGGYTPLHSAADAGNAPVVAALLQGGAMPDLIDWKGFSALDIAVVKGHQAAALVLLQGGASPSPPGVSGKTAVHLACKHNSPEMVELLLRGGALPGHCWNDLLQSPLMEGCFVGALDAVKALLPHLSVRQINLRDKIVSLEQGGMTALLAATICGKNEIDIVEALLEAGADPNIRMASTSFSPLEIVVSVEGVATDPTLGPSLVRMLTEAGADVNGVGPKGRTALHLACHEGACGEVVQALLDAGADERAPCAGMQFLTPLQLAGQGGNLQALRVLIGRPECEGLDAAGSPPERATVLSLAVRAGKLEVVRFLLEEGADMDLLPFEADGFTPSAKSLVHVAISEGHVDITRLLLHARRLKEEAERKRWRRRTPFDC